MRNLTLLSLAIAGLSGCFYYPSYYEPVPGYMYSHGSSVRVAPQPAAPQAPAVPQTPAAPAQPYAYQPAQRLPYPPPPPHLRSPAPAAPAPQRRGIVAHEVRLRELQQKRDQAQKELDDYLASCERERAAAIQPAPTPRTIYGRPTPLVPPVPPVPPVSVAPAVPAARARRPLSGIGFTFGARSLDQEIDGVSTLGSFGLNFSHRLRDSSLVVDLSFARAGFTETDELGMMDDRVFGSFEASAGVRFMSDMSRRAGHARGGSAWYIGLGAMDLNIVDRYEDSVSGDTITEEITTASGSYASAGMHFEGRHFGGGDIEVRQVMDTAFTTYGVERSADGLEVLARLAFIF